VTTNPAEATGDGVAMALRAGVAVADIEFVQFHPTALHHPAMPRPLLSEALRGHGALLRDADGQRFVDELAPRDVVSRAMAAQMSIQGVDHLWLDATALERFPQRFPTIAASLFAIGLDRRPTGCPSPPLPTISPVACSPTFSGHHPSRAVGRRRVGLHRGPRGQPPRLELTARGHGLRRPAAERIAAGCGGPEPSGAMRAVAANTNDAEAISGRVIATTSTRGSNNIESEPGIDLEKAGTGSSGP